MEEISKIKKGAPKRNPVCYQVLQDIVIPAGTMLRNKENSADFHCPVGINQPNRFGFFSVNEEAADMSPLFKKVAA